jgi:hypothetical protein
MDLNRKSTIQTILWISMVKEFEIVLVVRIDVPTCHQARLSAKGAAAGQYLLQLTPPAQPFADLVNESMEA